MSRRALLKWGAAGAAAAAAGGLGPFGVAVARSTSGPPLHKRNFPTPYQARFKRQRVTAPTFTSVIDGQPVHYYNMTQELSTARIVPGLDTPVFGYNGQFPGPLIHVDKGTRIVLRMANRLPAIHPQFGSTTHTSTHLHGSASLPQYDGYASDLCTRGRFKTYQYPNIQRARTLWYHDHGLHVTSQNVYSGLAAQYHVHDEIERALLPTQTDFDVALTLGDATFDREGRLVFDDEDHKGLWGDVILVNGKPWPTMKVSRRVYRFRLLNASIARSYKLRLSNGAPVVMVATDGGLMPVAQPVTEWRHGSAERYEFLVDFRSYEPGTRIELRNDSPENNRDYKHTDKVMRFEVVDAPVDTSDPSWDRIPTTLDSCETMELQRAEATVRRHFRLKRDEPSDLWIIEGRDKPNPVETWDDVVASGFKAVMAEPALGAVEVWKWENSSGGWHHPLHMHLIDFQILKRNGMPPFAYEKGPKDVVFVGENETVDLLMKFGPHKGRYMVHCHNLPHEDHDMMSQFRVGPNPDPDPDPNDPIDADPPQDDV